MAETWRLQQAIAALQAGVRAAVEEDGDLSLDVAADLPEEAEALEQALRGVVASYQRDTELAAAAKAAAENAAARARRFADRAQRQKGIILAAMDAMAWRKKEWPEATVSLRAPQPGVQIIDDTLLPEAFVRIARSPDKETIRAALKAGNAVPGAVLTNGVPGIQIRSS